jgi:RNA polymerase sigma-70 factor (ECF subfamily)
MTAIEFNNHVVMLKDKLKLFAYSLTANREDAKDLLHDTLLKAFTYRDKFSDKTNLAAWLYTIMKNTFINNYRRKKKANTFMDDTKDAHFINIPQTKGSISPASVYTEKEILNGINNLISEYKIPFKMHLEGFKYKEIADSLNLPIGTVKSRIFLARQELMKLFKNYNYEN